jgi:hypothetical protein
MVPTTLLCSKFTLLSRSKLTVYFGNERWIDIVLLSDPNDKQNKIALIRRNYIEKNTRKT